MREGDTRISIDTPQQTFFSEFFLLPSFVAVTPSTPVLTSCQLFQIHRRTRLATGRQDGVMITGRPKHACLRVGAGCGLVQGAGCGVYGRTIAQNATIFAIILSRVLNSEAVLPGKALVWKKNSK